MNSEYITSDFSDWGFLPAYQYTFKNSCHALGTEVGTVPDNKYGKIPSLKEHAV